MPINTNFSEDEATRLTSALRAAWAVPWVDDIVGFIWEAIFHYVKGLSIPDRLLTKQHNITEMVMDENSLPTVIGETLLTNSEAIQISKRLYDAVDSKAQRGWSLKAVQLKKKQIPAGTEVSFVIQRADIFKKYVELGFNTELSKDSDPNDLGLAIVKHWNRKVEQDGIIQGVQDGRLAVLVKDDTRQHYIYVEFPIEKFVASDFDWIWTDAKKMGLQARDKITGRTTLRWYAGQKQLFQSILIPDTATRVSITPKRAEVNKFVQSMLDSIS